MARPGDDLSLLNRPSLSPTRPARPRLADLAKAVPMLRPADSLGKALRLFGTTGHAVLPVVEGSVLMGVITEADLLAWLASHDGRLTWVEAGASHDAMVMQAMRTDLTVGDAHAPLDVVLPLFEVEGFKALPVVEADGRFRGMLLRHTVLAALSHNLRPAKIGGMATPLGVYLTTGNLSAGAGFWGLFLNGFGLTLLNFGILLGFHHARLAFGWRVPEAVEVLAALGLFLLALRLSPLSGFHAAEHQTVNAIEAGESLDLETIAGMPRVHPRCGTNLMALLFSAQLLLPLLAAEPLWLLPAIAALWLGWRKVGGWIQQVFTTKPPRRYQLQSGLRAGEELMRAFQQQPAYRASRVRRFWNMGMVQILAGGLSAFAAIELASHFIPSLRGILN
jgi:CBS domain-containing protein